MDSTIGSPKIDLILGTYDHIIDSKGRITLPSRFKDYFLKQDTNELVITKHLRYKKLLIYKPNVFYEKLNETKTRLTQSDLQEFQKRIAQFSHMIDMDKMGRIIIPGKLRKEAELNKDIMVVGAINNIEIWSKEEFNKDLSSFDSKSFPITDFS